MENGYAEVAHNLVSAKEPRPLEKALNEHGGNLEKLGGLVSSLEDRLQTVRNSVPTDPNSDGSVRGGGSIVVNQIYAQTQIVQGLQYRITALLEELDV